MNNKTSGQWQTKEHQNYFLWTLMDKTTSELLLLDSDGQDNIRATSTGQQWTRQHQSYFLWTEMDRTTSELLPLDRDGQENIGDLWAVMDKTTSELLPLDRDGQKNIRATCSAQQRPREQQNYFFWTAMHKTASELLLLDSNGHRKAHLQQHRVWGMLVLFQSDKVAAMNKLVSFWILTSHRLLWVTSGLHGKGCHGSRFPQQTKIQNRQGCWCCSNVIKLLPSRRIKRDCRTTHPHQHKSLRDAGTVPSMTQLLP